MRCVLYLRMSRDEQERSIGEQRDALRQYAKKKNYRIVGEYVDEGISGDATEKRIQFQRMIADCPSKTFELVLAWDQDRFGRFDPLEAGYWIKPMRDAGVVLETIAQGRVDWNDFAGRLVWSVTQEAKHSFLRDLARNSLRGNIARAKEGKTAGPAPFGYERGEDGRYVLGDEEKIAAVRRAFDLRALGFGYYVIARKLTEENRPSPTGTWSKEAVRIIILREAYTGTFVFGQRNCGKYQTTRDGIVTAQTSTVKINRNPLKVPNAHPAIITPQQWQAAQRFASQPPKAHATRGNSGAPLAGLLFCECGAAMYSQSLNSRQVTPNYICGRYHKGMGCGYRSVSQPWIHDRVATVIKTQILGESRQELLDRIKLQLANEPPSELQSLQRRLTKLEKQIAEASDRILTINKRLVSGLETRLLAMQDQREQLLSEIGRVKKGPQFTAEQIAANLWSLGQLFEKEDPAFIRASLKSWFQKIVLIFEPGKKHGRGQAFKCVGGTLFGVSSTEWASLSACYP